MSIRSAALLFLTPAHYAIKTTSYACLALEKVPFFAFTIITIIITLKTQTSAMTDIPLTIRLFNALNSIIIYLSKLFLPFNFSPLYPHPNQSQSAIGYQHYLALFSFVACTGLALALWFKKHYAWLSAWCFYLVTLSPVLGLIQVGRQAAADRYAYLPTIAIYFMIGAGIYKLLTKLKTPIQLSVHIIGVLITIVLVIETQKQTLVWRNPVTLWLQVAQSYPEYGRAQSNLAVSYRNFGDYNRAVKHFDTALTLNQLPKFYLTDYAHSNQEIGQYSKAISIYNNLLAFDKKKPIPGLKYDCIYYNLGWTHTKLGQFQQAVNALMQISSSSRHYKNTLQLLSIIANNIAAKAEFPAICRKPQIRNAGPKPGENILTLLK